MSGGVAAIVLAAGESRRWGADNKLLSSVDGMPMVVRTVQAALAATARPVIVVTGHDAANVKRSLSGFGVTCVHADDFADGMSASLRRGVAALPKNCEGALICLGDMPWVSFETLDRLVAAFRTAPSAAVVPVYKGRRGNPVLLGPTLFPEIARLSGDRGARDLLKAHAGAVREIQVEDPAVLRDRDRPD